MKDPYTPTDMKHDAALCNHDAKIVVWERLFEALCKDMKSIASRHCMHDKKAIDIIEKAAGDLVDLHLGMER